MEIKPKARERVLSLSAEAARREAGNRQRADQGLLPLGQHLRQTYNRLCTEYPGTDHRPWQEELASALHFEVELDMKARITPGQMLMSRS